MESMLVSFASCPLNSLLFLIISPLRPFTNHCCSWLARLLNFPPHKGGWSPTSISYSDIPIIWLSSLYISTNYFIWNHLDNSTTSFAQKTQDCCKNECWTREASLYYIATQLYLASHRLWTWVKEVKKEVTQLRGLCIVPYIEAYVNFKGISGYHSTCMAYQLKIRKGPSKLWRTRAKSFVPSWHP